MRSTIDISEGACGQEVTLIAALKGILEDYDGSQCLLELIQNADDAGATEVSFILDRRQHGETSLVGSNMAALQNSALCVYNNASFTDKDLAAIQAVGGGISKRDTLTTGMFGLGFCSCYHLTECPSFITRDRVLFFDPCRKYLPNIDTGKPGRYYIFTDPNIRNQYMDQLAPFRLPSTMFAGCDLTGSAYGGTLFRFPLRTASQSVTSELKPGKPCTEEEVFQLYDKLVAMKSDVLVFLRHIRKVSMFVWDPMAEIPRELHRIQVSMNGDAISNSMEERYRMDMFVKNLLEQYSKNTDDPQTSFARLLLETNVSQYPKPIYDLHCIVTSNGELLCEDHWRILCGIGTGTALSVARDIINGGTFSKLLPIGGIALLLSRTAMANTGISRSPGVVGRAYCTLPLPILTGLSFHVNGRFSVARNRRSLVDGDDMHGKSKLVEYNRALLMDTIVDLIVLAIESIVRDNQFWDLNNLNQQKTAKDIIDTYFRIWPSLLTVTETPWNLLLSPLYQQLSNRIILPIFSYKSQCFRFVSLVDARFDNIEAQSGEAHRQCVKMIEDLKSNYTNNHKIDILKSKLSNWPSFCDLENLLVMEEFPLLYAPKWIYPQFTQAGVIRVQYLVPEDVRLLFKNPVSSNQIRVEDSGHPCLYTNCLSSIITLLKYCLLDMVGNENNYKSLIDVCLLPLESGCLTTFGGKDNKPCAYLCTIDTEALLRERAPHLLISTSVATAISDFYCMEFQSICGVIELDCMSLSTLLPTLLPSDWRQRQRVMWNCSNNREPSVEWMTAFWHIIVSCDPPLTSLSLFEDWPLIPTHIKGNSYLVSPTATNAIIQRRPGHHIGYSSIDDREISIELRIENVLKTLSIPVLDDSFCVILPHGYDLASIDSKGIINTLWHLQESMKESSMTGSSSPFSLLSNDQRYDILLFINRELTSVSNEFLARLAQLPLFKLLNDSSGNRYNVISGNNKVDAQYVTLDLGPFYTLPFQSNNVTINSQTSSNDDAPILTSIKLLERFRDIESLYSKLGIRSLSTTRLLLDFMIPAISHVSEEQCVLQMNIIRQYIENLNIHNTSDSLELISEDEMNSVWIKLKALSFMKGPDGRLYSVSHFVDPSISLLKLTLPMWIPPFPYQSSQWLPFLRLLGLQYVVNKDLFISIANSVMQNDIRNARQYGEALIHYLVEHTLDSDLVTETFWSEVRSISFVPTLQHGRSPDVKDADAPLSSFAQVYESHYFSLVWSQAPVLPDDIQISFLMKRRLQILSPDVNIVIRHLKYMIKCFNNYNFSLERDCFVILSELREIYSWVDQECVKAIGHGNFIRQNLSTSEPLFYRVISSTTSSLTSWSLQFIKPCDLYYNITEEIIPYIYKVDDWLVRGGRFVYLLETLEIGESPTPERVLQVLAAIGRDAEEERPVNDVRDYPLSPISDARFHQIISLLFDLSSYFNKLVNNKQHNVASIDDIFNINNINTNGIKLPDDNQVLIEISNLYIWDTPWLTDRIHRSNLHIIHKSIPMYINQLFHIKCLSLNIIETIDEATSSIITQFKNDDVDRWRATIRSLEFRQGLIRLIRYEEMIYSRRFSSIIQTSGGLTLFNQRLNQLKSIKIQIVEQLHTRFYLKQSNNLLDITKSTLGSLTVTDIVSSTIFMIHSNATSMMICNLSIELNSWLMSIIQNLQPLSVIIDIHTLNEIHSILCMLRIPEVVLSSEASNVGKLVSDRDVERLICIADDVANDIDNMSRRTINVNDECVWRDDDERYRYGIMKAFISSNELLLQIDYDDEIQVFNDTRVWRVLSTQEFLIYQRSRSMLSKSNHASIISKNNHDDSSRTYDGLVNVAQPEFNPRLNDEVHEPTTLFVRVNSASDDDDSSSTMTEYIPVAPCDPDYWTKEKQLAISAETRAQTVVLEPEPADVDEILAVKGTGDISFIKRVSNSITSRKNISPGFDIIRWGLIDDIALFHWRCEEVTDERISLCYGVVSVIKDVCSVFEYDPYFITIFWQPRAVSRFVDQRLLFNIWPVEQRRNEFSENNSNQIFDCRNDPFTYCYFYGLLIHKLCHFFDIVHGTRHDFLMNEARIETLDAWLSLLEKKGWNPEVIESGPLRKLLVDVVF